MAEEILLTSDGLKELQDELEQLKTTGRKDIAEKIKVALIDESELSSDIVNRASRIVIRDMKLKEDFTYQIVGPQQADPIKGRISDESPVGKALLGHKKGDTVEVEAPAGKLKYKIIEIEKKK